MTLNIALQKAIDSGDILRETERYRRLLIGSADGNVYGVGLRDGKEFWKHSTGKDVTASPAVGENCLVVGTEGSRGTIYCFGSKEP